MTAFGRQLLARDPTLLTEKDLQSLVVETARMLGWTSYHTYNSRRSTSGFPDLLLVHPDKRRIVYIELKSEVGRLSVAQQVWVSLLANAGAEVHVFRPSDWDVIVQVLKGFARDTEDQVP